MKKTIHSESLAKTGQYSERTRSSFSKESRSAIIVSDNTLTLMITRAALDEKNFIAHNAQDVTSALGILSEHKKVNLVILSGVTTDSNSVEMIKTLRLDPQMHKTPILVLTGSKRLKDQVLLKEAGADAWISKPYTQKLLTQIIDIIAF